MRQIKHKGKKYKLNLKKIVQIKYKENDKLKIKKIRKR